MEKTMTVFKDDQNVEVPTLSGLDARLLNTFTRRETSQDPFSGLQNQKTRKTYIATWQQLICYWDRVVEQRQLRDEIFQQSDRQKTAWDELKAAASKLASLTDPDCDDVATQASRNSLDEAVLKFSLAIIQHSVGRRRFDSVLVSYAAVRFWSHSQRSWMPIGDYTSILSQLIYDCQLMVLAKVLAENEKNPDADIGDMIVDIRDQWLLNDTKGPVVELLQNRLLGMKIAKDEVPPAQLRWNAKGDELVWQDVIFRLEDLNHIIFKGIAEARRIFDEELCLISRSTPAYYIPRLNLGLLVDNWSATAKGQSFMSDVRNACYFDPLNEWLFSRVETSHEVSKRFWDPTFAVYAGAVKKYEDAVQRFLEALMVPFFIGSGQQARRTEFIGLLWKNSRNRTRDLFIHDGQMIFILSYHKTRSQSNASRWPVRYLLPEVAQLVVQFLALVQPFRDFLHGEAPGSGDVSPYLWSRNFNPWKEDAMTRVVVATGKRILGKEIHVRAWRQITVGIAREKFKTSEANLLVEEGGDDDETDPALGSMSDAFHWQAAHTPHTGNRDYGGSVDFRGGLTSAGLHEFRRVSQLWHQLVRDPLNFRRILPSETANHVLKVDVLNGA
jgi:hypothetical protein